MYAIDKGRTEEEVKNFVVEVALNRLQKMKLSKFWPKGGFRQGWGYNFKVYGKLDIITVNARTFLENENNMYKGRLMINGNIYNEVNKDKQFSRVVNLVDQFKAEGVTFNFELCVCNGNGLWFAWSII